MIRGLKAAIGGSLPRTALGSFDGIDFGLGSGIGGRLGMGGEIAMALLPFQSRFRAGAAVPAGILLAGSLAALALLNDFMAGPAVVGTPLGSHKRTFVAFTNSFTNH